VDASGDGVVAPSLGTAPSLDGPPFVDPPSLVAPPSAPSGSIVNGAPPPQAKRKQVAKPKVNRPPIPLQRARHRARLQLSSSTIAIAISASALPRLVSMAGESGGDLMSNRIGTLAALAFLSLAAACGSSSSSPNAAANGQVVRGTVALSAYAIDNPVVVARTADGRAFFAPVLADGSFAITLPPAASVRLSLANTTRTGGYVAISRILWPGKNVAWARLDGSTAAIALGHVRPSGAGGAQIQDHGGTSYDSDGGSGGSSSSSSGGGGGGGSSDGHSGDQSSSGDSSSGHCSEGSGEVHACGTTPTSRAELPYDVRPPLGSTFQLKDAFLAKGTAPAAIVGVTMDGGSWRLAELQADTPFVVTQGDCDHAGNRAVGRDRVVVTWKNPDGTTASDHLDLRYCDGSVSAQSDGADHASSDGMEPDDCESDGTPVCAAPTAQDSECDGASSGTEEDDGDHGYDVTCGPGASGSSSGTPSGSSSGTVSGSSSGGAATPPPPPPSGGIGTVTGGGAGTTSTPGGGAQGDVCTVNADCGTGLLCVASRCAPVIF
jgi:hypothetical protein